MSRIVYYSKWTLAHFETAMDGVFMLLSLFRLTNTFCWHLSGIATLYSDKLTNITSTDPEIQTNSLITNIFLEVCSLITFVMSIYHQLIRSIIVCFAGFKEYIVRAKRFSTIYSNFTSWRCLDVCNASSHRSIFICTPYLKGKKASKLNHKYISSTHTLSLSLSH